MDPRFVDTITGRGIPLRGHDIETVLYQIGLVAGEKDTVLIYFAGHGIYEERTTIAFWVPTDAQAGVPISYLSASSIAEAVQRMQANKVIIISDSCFSGALLRGGGGLFYDRPAGNSIFGQIQNPPTIRNLTLRYAGLQSLAGGLTTEAPPALSVYQYKSGLPATWQWNTGVQIMLTKSTVLDAAYTGEHATNLVENVDINAVDFGVAFLPGNQDPTQTSPLPGAAVVPTDQMRAFRGFSGISQAVPRSWLNAHTLELSLTRRFTRGLAFGLNDTILLVQRGSTAARLQHNPDGTFSERPDQKDQDAEHPGEDGSTDEVLAEVHDRERTDGNAPGRARWMNPLSCRSLGRQWRWWH